MEMCQITVDKVMNSGWTEEAVWKRNGGVKPDANWKDGEVESGRL